MKPFYSDAQGHVRSFDVAEIRFRIRYEHLRPGKGTFIRKIFLFVQLSNSQGTWLRGDGGPVPDPDIQPFTTWTDEWERVDWVETTLGEMIALHRQTGRPLPPWLKAVIEEAAEKDEGPPPKKARKWVADREILDVLKDVGHRLSTREILAEMTRRGHNPSESTVGHRLAEMVKDGRLTKDRKARPPGYGLPGW
jgi:hypothetical protein